MYVNLIDAARIVIILSIKYGFSCYLANPCIEWSVDCILSLQNKPI